jgi:hypothetical protein
MLERRCVHSLEKEKKRKGKKRKEKERKEKGELCFNLNDLLWFDFVF